jgi:hypothetical protein
MSQLQRPKYDDFPFESTLSWYFFSEAASLRWDGGVEKPSGSRPCGPAPNILLRVSSAPPGRSRRFRKRLKGCVAPLRMANFKSRSSPVATAIKLGCHQRRHAQDQEVPRFAKVDMISRLIREVYSAVSVARDTPG